MPASQPPQAVQKQRRRPVNHSRRSPDFFRPDHRGQPAGADANRVSAAAPRTVTSQSLFLGEREIGIEHHGALYRLKITRQGKLILNK